jgi:hypothetical protein
MSLWPTDPDNLGLRAPTTMSNRLPTRYVTMVGEGGCAMPTP